MDKVRVVFTASAYQDVLLIITGVGGTGIRQLSSLTTFHCHDCNQQP